MKKIFVLMTVCALFLLCGCNTVIEDNEIKDKSKAEDTAYNLSFTESELDASYTLNGATYVTLGDEDVKIIRAGTYVLEGTLNGSVIVEVSKSEDVQLVLNNVTINAGDFAGIYIIEGDEITITLADGSINYIADSDTYTQIDENKVDALIYSKADLIINGTGVLNLSSDYNHGIVSKDDLVIANGTFNINTAGQGLRGKDRLMIADGVFNITCGKDALKSDNDENEYRGYVYITGGTFNINTSGDGIYGYTLVNIEGGTFSITTSKSADTTSYKGIKSGSLITISGGSFVIDAADDGIHSDGDVSITGGSFSISSNDDGIHGDALVQIDAGEIDITAYEGIEGTYILINGGTISISASDDGINAGAKVSSYTPTVEINDGYLTIVMGQGDTDGIDSNGSIIINGGTIDISGQSPFDYDISAELNGGTLIVNGSQTSEITNQFNSMGGMGGMGGTMPGGEQPDNNQDFPGGSQSPEGQPSGDRPQGGHQRP